MYCSNECIDFVCWKIPTAIHQPIQSGLENHNFVSPESYLLASLTYGKSWKSAIYGWMIHSFCHHFFDVQSLFFSADEFPWWNRWISVRHSSQISLKFELSKFKMVLIRYAFGWRNRAAGMVMDGPWWSEVRVSLIHAELGVWGILRPLAAQQAQKKNVVFINLSKRKWWTNVKCTVTGSINQQSWLNDVFSWLKYTIYTYFVPINFMIVKLVWKQLREVWHWNWGTGLGWLS